MSTHAGITGCLLPKVGMAQSTEALSRSLPLPSTRVVPSKGPCPSSRHFEWNGGTWCLDTRSASSHCRLVALGTHGGTSARRHVATYAHISRIYRPSGILSLREIPTF